MGILDQMQITDVASLAEELRRDFQISILEQDERTAKVKDYDKYMNPEKV